MFGSLSVKFPAIKTALETSDCELSAVEVLSFLFYVPVFLSYYKECGVQYCLNCV